ncbi:unnamed protein product [Scytosiphon promiscuus]
MGPVPGCGGSTTGDIDCNEKQKLKRVKHPNGKARGVRGAASGGSVGSGSKGGNNADEQSATPEGKQSATPEGKRRSPRVQSEEAERASAGKASGGKPRGKRTTCEFDGCSRPASYGIGDTVRLCTMHKTSAGK